MSFVNKSTSTDGKFQYELGLTSHIPRHRNGEKIMTLIGCIDGLERQLKLLTSGGAKYSDIIIVERDVDTYKALKKAQSKFDYILYHGDFMDCLDICFQRGVRFSLIDYDGTEAIGEYTFMLAALCSKNLSKFSVLHIIASPRAGIRRAEFIKKMSEDLGMPKIKRKKYIPVAQRTNNTSPYGYSYRYAYPGPTKVFERWLRDRTRLYLVKSTYYRGLQYMRAFIIRPW